MAKDGIDHWIATDLVQKTVRVLRTPGSTPVYFYPALKLVFPVFLIAVYSVSVCFPVTPTLYWK